MVSAAQCPQHPETAAEWTCGRCGTFFCEGCAKRVRPEAVPMCSGCWELRNRTVTPSDVKGGRLQTAALVVGFFALLPSPPLQLVALIVCILGVVRVPDEAARKVRWRAVTGLVLTGLGFVIDLLVFGALLAH